MAQVNFRTTNKKKMRTYLNIICSTQRFLATETMTTPMPKKDHTLEPRFHIIFFLCEKVFVWSFISLPFFSSFFLLTKLCIFFVLRMFSVVCLLACSFACFVLTSSLHLLTVLCGIVVFIILLSLPVVKIIWQPFQIAFFFPFLRLW